MGLFLALSPGLLALGCGPARDALVSTVPGAPDPSGCAPVGASRCTGATPEVCSASGRWWAALPAPCPHGCVAEDAGARCMARDAGVEP